MKQLRSANETLDEACQYISDLMLEDAFSRGELSAALLKEEFTRDDWTNMVNVITSINADLPVEMKNVRAALQRAIKTAKTSMISLNKGNINSEKFAKVVANVDAFSSAVGSAFEALRGIQSLSDLSKITPVQSEGGELKEQEAAMTVNDALGKLGLDDQDREIIKTSIEKNFKPEGFWANLLGKKKNFFGLTSDSLYDDIMSLTLPSLKAVLTGGVPEALAQAMSSEDAATVAAETGVAEKSSEESSGKNVSAAPKLRKAHLRGVLRSLDLDPNDSKLLDKMRSALSKYKINVEAVLTDREHIVLERWRRMAGITEDLK
ncbi:MAG: hypothetical protein ACW96N_04755 [Candidatus Thorarchaeota archaeon]|jgi:hypothetical protein